MTEAQDIVVIGGGHNGLVAASYLARSGRRVLILERRPTVGGVAAPEEVREGFHHAAGLSLCGLLRPEVVEDLGLRSHGLDILPLNPQVVSLGEDKALSLWRDVGRSRGEIAALSASDAEAYPRFVKQLTQMAQFLDPLMVRTPLEIADPSRGEQFYVARLGWGLRRLGKETMRAALRLPPLSLRDLLGEWFEADLLKATLAVDGLLGTFRGPWSPFTSFGLIRHFMAPEGWNLFRGGTKALTDALVAAAEGSKVLIRTNAEVKRITTKDGIVTGVELGDGEKIEAKTVVSSADPKRTLLNLADPADLEPSFALKVRNIQTLGCVAKVGLALDGPPKLPSAEGNLPARVRVAPSLEYIERAYDEAKYGRFPSAPFLDVLIPSAVDPGMAPSGKHVLAVHVQYAPYDLRKGSWKDWRDELGDLVVDTLGEYVPGLASQVIHREVWTPLDLEEKFGLSQGHLFQGEMMPNQLFFMRPVPGWAQYRTPIQGLYLCGSGTHPGGGISGAPGYNASREILRDLGARR